MDRERKIVFFISTDPLETNLNKDLTEDARVELVTGLFWGSEKLYSMARYISKKNKLKLRHQIFLFFYSLLFSKINRYVAKADVMVFTNPSVLGMSQVYYSLFFAIHRKTKPVLVFIDVATKHMGICAKRIADASKRTLCFSFDKGDAEKYGYEHTMCTYSKHNISPVATKTDVYFIGYAYDRLQMLQELGSVFSMNGVKSNINIAGITSEDRKEIDGIYYLNHYKQYDDVVAETKASNCILEIIQAEQSGATMRYYEALCYNKKLLTNNVHVKELPFYNPNYMQVFQNIDEIDMEWIKDSVPVDYHYDGRFSPVHLITEILQVSTIE